MISQHDNPTSDLGDRDFDALLDRALTTYTPAETRPGIENRILARIAGEESLPARRFSLFSIPLAWGSAAAFALIAAIVAVLLLRSHAPFSSPTLAHTPQQAPTIPAPSALPRPTIASSAHRPVRAHRAPTTTASARPAQQQMLVLLITHYQQAFASLAKPADEPDKPIAVAPLATDRLSIEPIAIAPIQDISAATGGTL